MGGKGDRWTDESEKEEGNISDEIQGTHVIVSLETNKKDKITVNLTLCKFSGHYPVEFSI